MVGQREENGKGAHSLPLLMQIALKESREAKKVLFNGRWTNTDVSAHMLWGRLKRRGKVLEKQRGKDLSQKEAQNSSVICTLCTHLDPVVRPLFRNVPLSQN